MDFLFPDDDAIKKMSKEYATLKKNAESIAKACGNANIAPDGIAQNNLATYCNGCDSGVTAPLILLLYFMFGLRYNSTYEYAFYDTDRGVGRVQSSERTLGNVNNFFDRGR